MLGRPIALLGTSLALAGLMTMPALGTTIAYDPALGSLPEAQGFSYVDLAPSASAPAVVGGVLRPGAVTTAELRYWIREDLLFAFDQGFTLDFELRAISSEYTLLQNDGSQRSGFYVEAIDTAGRRITVGIAGAGVTLNTDGALMPSNGIPLFPLDTSVLHHYLVTAGPDSIRLFVDGSPRGSTPLGARIFTSHDVYFGDGTTAAGSQVELGRVGFSYAGGTTGVAAAPRGSAALRVRATGGLGRAVELAVSDPAGSTDTIRILDVSGRLVRDLGPVVATAGGTVVRWSGADGGGRPAPAGVYFVTAAGTGGRASCRLVMLR